MSSRKKSVKKNRQFFYQFEIINRNNKNALNLFAEQNTAKNIVLNALKQFFKTLKKNFFEQQLKIFFITQKMFEIQISKIRFATKSSNFVFIKKMRKLTKNNIYFDKMSFNFRIIVIILQKIDYLI